LDTWQKLFDRLYDSPYLDDRPGPSRREAKKVLRSGVKAYRRGQAPGRHHDRKGVLTEDELWNFANTMINRGSLKEGEVNKILEETPVHFPEIP
jgi:hypothetical protein